MPKKQQKKVKVSKKQTSKVSKKGQKQKQSQSINISIDLSKKTTSRKPSLQSNKVNIPSLYPRTIMSGSLNNNANNYLRNALAIQQKQLERLNNNINAYRQQERSNLRVLTPKKQPIIYKGYDESESERESMPPPMGVPHRTPTPARDIIRSSYFLDPSESESEREIQLQSTAPPPIPTAEAFEMGESSDVEILPVKDPSIHRSTKTRDELIRDLEQSGRGGLTDMTKEELYKLHKEVYPKKSKRGRKPKTSSPPPPVSPPPPIQLVRGTIKKSTKQKLEEAKQKKAEEEEQKQAEEMAKGFFEK